MGTTRSISQSDGKAALKSPEAANPMSLSFNQEHQSSRYNQGVEGYQTIAIRCTKCESAREHCRPDAFQLLSVQCPANDNSEEILEKLASCPLTRSELNIAKLKLAHLSNRQIAQRLHVSHATIKTHLNNIHRKLGDPIWLEFQKATIS